MKKFSLLLALTVLITSMTSCLESGDEPSYSTTLNYVGYNHVHNPETNESTLKATSYVLVMDFINMTLDLQISSGYTPDSEPVTIQMKGLKLTMDKEGYKFTSAEKTPDAVSSGRPEDYIVRNLSGRISSYFYQDQEIGSVREVIVLETSYRISDKYDVFACTQTPYFPNCETVTRGDSEPYTSTTATYEIELTDTKTANVKINNIRFHKQMPQITMTVEKVPVELLPYGYRLKIDEVIPKISDVPADDYKITNFETTVSSNGTAMTLGFNCNYKGTPHMVSATGSQYPEIEDNNDK